MNKYFVILIAFFGMIAFASCDKSLNEPQQEFPVQSKLRVDSLNAFSPTRVPVTGWHFNGIQGHVFYGIDGDDYYVVGVSNYSSVNVTVEIEELNQNGSPIDGNPIYGTRFIVLANGSTTKVFSTNNDVYSVRITTLTAGASGYINLVSSNRN